MIKALISILREVTCVNAKDYTNVIEISSFRCGLFSLVKRLNDEINSINSQRRLQLNKSGKHIDSSFYRIRESPF